MLPGKFNITCRESDLGNAIMTKAESNLRNEFDKIFFYINDDNKEKIRIELEHCNISEANLFPELEYQLRYIRTHNEKLKREVSYFEKFQYKELENFDDVGINDNNIMDVVKESINEFKLGKELDKSIEKIFADNQSVDWLKRDSIISRIKVLVCKELMHNSYTRETAEKISKDIIGKIMEKQTAR